MLVKVEELRLGEHRNRFTLGRTFDNDDDTGEERLSHLCRTHVPDESTEGFHRHLVTLRVQLSTSHQQVLAGSCFHLGTDIVILVLAAVHQYDAVASGYVEEVGTMGRNEELVARIRQRLELLHQTALRMRMQVQFGLLDAEHGITSERLSKSASTSTLRTPEPTSNGFRGTPRSTSVG